MLTMTIAASHQLYLLIYNYCTYIACYTAPLKNIVTALLEYIDLLTGIQGALDGAPSFQAEAQGKMPQLLSLPSVGGTDNNPYTLNTAEENTYDT